MLNTQSFYKSIKGKTSSWKNMSVVLQVMRCALFVQLLKTLRTVTHAIEKQNGQKQRGKANPQERSWSSNPHRQLEA